MKRRFSYWALALVVAFVMLLAFAGVAMAAVPANGGGGLAFGDMHAQHAQDGMLGGSMNPGTHQGIYGWTGM